MADIFASASRACIVPNICINLRTALLAVLLCRRPSAHPGAVPGRHPRERSKHNLFHTGSSSRTLALSAARCTPRRRAQGRHLRKRVQRLSCHKRRLSRHCPAVPPSWQRPGAHPGAVHGSHLRERVQRLGRRAERRPCAARVRGLEQRHAGAPGVCRAAVERGEAPRAQVRRIGRNHLRRHCFGRGCFGHFCAPRRQNGKEGGFLRRQC